jgi:hypothetical protein
MKTGLSAFGIAEDESGSANIKIGPGDLGTTEDDSRSVRQWERSQPSVEKNGEHSPDMV